MRLSLVVLTALQAVTSASAQEPVTDIKVVTGVEQTLKGVVSGGDTKVLTVQSTTAVAMNIILDGINGVCGIDLRPDSRATYTEYRNFPATASIRSNGTDPIRLSVYLTRSARMNNASCEYNVTVKGVTHAHRCLKTYSSCKRQYFR